MIANTIRGIVIVAMILISARSLDKKQYPEVFYLKAA